MRWILLASVLACGGNRICPGDAICVQSMQRQEICELPCAADGGGCPSGTSCVQLEACCSGMTCLAALRTVCCPASGC